MRRITGASNNTGLIILHGGEVDWSAYSPMANWVTQAGYRTFLARFGADGTICAAPPLPARYDELDEIMDAHPEITKWVFAGHSLGGTLATGYLGKRQAAASRVNGIVYWASYANIDLSDNSVYGFLSGDNVLASKDGVATWPIYENSAVNLPNPSRTYCIEGGNHAQFGWYGPQSDEDESQKTLSRAEQQIQIREQMMAYLDFVENDIPFTADDNTAETEACNQFVPSKK